MLTCDTVIILEVWKIQEFIYGVQMWQKSDESSWNELLLTLRDEKSQYRRINVIAEKKNENLDYLQSSASQSRQPHGCHSAILP